jgi:hypothetical protein
MYEMRNGKSSERISAERRQPSHMGGRWTTTECYHEQKRGGQSDSADA